MIAVFAAAAAVHEHFLSSSCRLRSLLHRGEEMDHGLARLECRLKTTLKYANCKSSAWLRLNDEGRLLGMMS